MSHLHSKLVFLSSLVARTLNLLIFTLYHPLLIAGVSVQLVCREPFVP